MPRDNVKLLKALGQGSFGTVYEGKLIDFIENQPELYCAVKTVAEDTPGEERALFLKEAALMTKLSCNHVVKLLGIVSKSQPIYVIMELMMSDLKNYLRGLRPDTEKKDAPPPPTLKVVVLSYSCSIVANSFYSFVYLKTITANFENIFRNC